MVALTILSCFSENRIRITPLAVLDLDGIDESSIFTTWPRFEVIIRVVSSDSMIEE